MAHDEILVLTTGGTIAMVNGATGTIENAAVVEHVQATHGGALRWVDAGAIDSAAATPANWTMLAATLSDHLRGARAVLVTHGTDTLGWSAAALATARSWPVPVVVVGAQHPLGVDGSDAPHQLDAAAVAALALPAGVWVVADGAVSEGGFVRKFRDGPGGIAPVDGKPYAMIDRGELRALRPARTLPSWAASLSGSAPAQFTRDVGVHRCWPGIHAPLADQDHVVIELYGAGTASAALLEAVADAVASGQQVTCVPPSPLSTGPYASTAALRDAGAVVHLDGTVELAVATAARAPADASLPASC